MLKNILKYFENKRTDICQISNTLYKLKLIKTVVLAQEWTNRLIEEKSPEKELGIEHVIKMAFQIVANWYLKWDNGSYGKDCNKLFHYLISTIKYFPDGIQDLNVKKK